MFSSQMRFNAAFSNALISGKIKPHFQPIVSFENGKIVGFEVLSRWFDDDQGAIPPSIFIPYVEKWDMLDELLNSIMQQSFEAAQLWGNEIFLGFNLSPKQLIHPSLPERIFVLAQTFKFPLHRINIEITESSLIENEQAAKLVLGKLIKLGCTVSLDDFGTGYSSLTWLRTLPFSKIKIDTSFVIDMIEHKDSRKIVSAVIGLGQSLGLSVVAEGVESREQAELLRRLGCEFGQGFYFGRGVPAEQVLSLFQSPTKSINLDFSANISLEQRLHQIHAIYNAGNLAVCFVDRDMYIRDASFNFGKIFGISPIEIMNRPLAAIVPECVGRISWFKLYWSIGVPAPVYEKNLTSGESILFFIHQVNDEAGEILGYSIIVTDNPNTKLAPR